MACRRIAFCLALAFFTLVASSAETASGVPAGLSGEWELTTIVFGVERGERLTLKVEKGTLAGSIYRRGKNVPISGKVEGRNVTWELQQEDGGRSTFAGRVDGERLSGALTVTGGQQWGDAPLVEWRARRVPADRPASPRVLDFTPSAFHRVFSASIEPVLRIWPGDIVRTKTVDAGGVDEHGQTRVLGGNPQTGPFYVEGAMPGDVLAVRLRKLRLNRPSAISDDGFVDRALNGDYVSDHKDNKFDDVVWTLDLEKGTASPARPTARLAYLVIPVRPMLGCVGVAPGFGSAPIRTGDSGRFGGNMDFSEVREGATLYLPVAQPGALLYLGDGHAVQGDGELNGNALETSLDVEFSVDVLREKRIGGPRVENAEFLMAMGLGGSLDEAFRDATSELANWLEQDYKLTGPEVAILLGPTIEYQISEVADRNVGIVAKIRKRFLSPTVTK